MATAAASRPNRYIFLRIALRLPVVTGLTPVTLPKFGADRESRGAGRGRAGEEAACHCKSRANRFLVLPRSASTVSGATLPRLNTPQVDPSRSLHAMYTRWERSKLGVLGPSLIAMIWSRRTANRV